jgi:hypothetical protein
VGERNRFQVVRRIGAATLVLGAAVALTSCSGLGATPGSGVSPSDPVVDTPVASASATATPPATAEPVASETPIAVATPTQAADGRTAVVPLITTPDRVDAGQPLDVSALITGVIESDGTCSVVVSSGDTEKRATTPGVAASSYTACQAVTMKGLAAGSWRISVQYSSAESAGTAVKTVVVG